MEGKAGLPGPRGELGLPGMPGEKGTPGQKVHVTTRRIAANICSTPNQGPQLFFCTLCVRVLDVCCAFCQGEPGLVGETGTPGGKGLEGMQPDQGKKGEAGMKGQPVGTVGKRPLHKYSWLCNLTILCFIDIRTQIHVIN